MFACHMCVCVYRMCVHLWCLIYIYVIFTVTCLLRKSGVRVCVCVRVREYGLLTIPADDITNGTRKPKLNSIIKFHLNAACEGPRACLSSDEGYTYTVTGWSCRGPDYYYYTLYLCAQISTHYSLNSAPMRVDDRATVENRTKKKDNNWTTYKLKTMATPL